MFKLKMCNVNVFVLIECSIFDETRKRKERKKEIQSVHVVHMLSHEINSIIYVA